VALRAAIGAPDASARRALGVTLRNLRLAMAGSGEAPNTHMDAMWTLRRHRSASAGTPAPRA
jgi:hypothetical protein